MIKRILFVEDETHIASLYAIVLRKHKYEVDVVADGIEGFEAAKSGKYDLVLLDLMLPNMSGMEILHGLHDPAKNPGGKIPHITVLTNLGEDDETVHDIRTLGADYLLKVNYTPGQLVEYIDNIQPRNTDQK